MTIWCAAHTHARDEDKAAFLARSRQALLDLAPNGGRA